MPDPSGKLGHEEARHMDEQTFLREYRKTDYPRPSVTVDIVIFTVVDCDLKVLLIRRVSHPFQGQLALPGGFVDVGDAFEDQGEDLDAAAFRELAEETGLEEVVLRQHNVHLEQLYTFGKAYRDPRTRVIGVAHYALVPSDLVPLVVAGDDAAEAGWFSVGSEIDLNTLAFDHAKILRTGIERIRGKIDYSPIAFSLVPTTFTVGELQEVYEAIKGEHYDVRTFRRRFKRMQTDGVIVEAPGKRRPDGGGRPAKVYRFVR